MDRRSRVAATIAIIAVAALVAVRIRSLDAAASLPTPCQQVIAQCHAKRLPNLTLTGKEKSGALRSVDGFDLKGVISFDQALRRGWEEAHFEDAKTVRVILGSADATELSWGNGKRLFYAIDWTGICGLVIGPSPVPGYSPPPTCGGTTWGTVIDAKTGAFVVEGTG